jgi:predicted metal-dependent enzyme (double-stranded beta helix superfamily)
MQFSAREGQMTTAKTYRLQEFVDDARAIVARRLGEQRTLEALIEPLQRIISRPDCLADMEPQGNPDPERGFTVFADDDLTIACVIWPVGGGAPVHNHNGWALEGVISGMERNRNYERRDDGSTPWRAQLEEVAPSIVAAGQTTCLALPPNDIHAVEIPGAKTNAIHLYGLNLAKQWRYRFDLETGEVTPFTRGAPLAPRP